MKRVVIRTILICLVLLLFINISLVSANNQSSDTIAPGFDDELEAIQRAIDTAVENSTELYVLIYDLRIEKISISGNYALAIVNFIDKLTGEIVPTESGYILAHKIESGWVAIFPNDPAWKFQILQTPNNLISPDLKEHLTNFPEKVSVSNINAYDGYFLPWEGGQSRTLSRSISHGSGPSYYAFDFYSSSDPYFNVTAARSGIVWYAKWDVPRGAGDCDANINYVNYIVIQNDIGLYDLYLHLDYNSIPPHLRARGNPVGRGEKVGNADTTGCSSGAHLHFMAHTTSASYWGTSVDITFQDVNVCDGRPRTPDENPACGVRNYVSGNYLDSTPPISNISLSGTAGENGWYRSAVNVTITATDNLSGVAYSQYNLDNADWLTYNGPITIGVEGSHLLQYRSVDLAGNWETSKSVDIKIDSIAPANPMTITSGCTAQNNIWQNTCSDPTFTWSVASDATSGVVGYEFIWDGNPAVWTTTPSYDPPGVPDGSYPLLVRVKDNAGNWSRWVTLFTLNFDATPPSGSIVLMEGWETSNQTSIRINTSASDNASGLDSFQVRNVGTDWSGWLPHMVTSPWVLPGLTDHLYTVEVQYKDRAGNISSIYSDSIYLDIYPERPASQNFQLRKSTFGISGTNVQSDNFRLTGTLSQVSVTGYSQSGHYQVISGFWSRISKLVELFSNYLPLITK